MNTYENQSQSQNRYGSNESSVDHGKSRVDEREGRVARAIEKQTAKLPSDLFLWAAGAAVLGSLAFQVFGKPKSMNFMGLTGRAPARAPLASFVGMWAPSILLLGVYNKLVKVAGSDRIER